MSGDPSTRSQRKEQKGREKGKANTLWWERAWQVQGKEGSPSELELNKGSRMRHEMKMKKQQQGKPYRFWRSLKVRYH